MILIVTGTSTGVGKTVVTAALAAIAGPSVTVIKPAQTGVSDTEPGDLAEVERLSGAADLVELARYPDPLSPVTAAHRSARPLLTLDECALAVTTIEHERLAVHPRLTLVEGAGGLLVPLGDGFTLRELASALEAPALVVVAAGLGTLNHAALTVEALTAAKVECAGLVIGSWPAEPDLAARCNLEDLPAVTGVPIVGRIPEGAGSYDRHRFVTEAPTWFDQNLQNRLCD